MYTAELMKDLKGFLLKSSTQELERDECSIIWFLRPYVFYFGGNKK